MKSTSFLAAVAKAYLGRYNDLSEFCFVFPNKRSGTFFLKALSENLDGRVMLAPEVLSVDAFMAAVSGIDADSRIDLLFRLYKVYRRLAGAKETLDTEADVLDFDRFGPWGETLLLDFSEIDKYDADAKALLSNVRNLREIESNFLSPEQCDALERLLGVRPSMDALKGFWKTLLPAEGEDQETTYLKQRFVELWTLLPELYEGLTADLAAEGLGMTGTLFREAMRRVLELGADAVPWRKVVVVGFNLLSTSEYRLFGELRDSKDADGEPFAEFFWDASGPVLGKAASANVASRTLRRYIKQFPMPEWALPYIAESHVSTLPERLEVVAAPSNAAQVKIAAARVKEWLTEAGPGNIANARAAVVLPDENLLLPLIHSLPDELETINLTMGYSMRYTAVASFMYHLRRIIGRIRRTDAGPAFYHEDLKLFLTHPLVQILAGEGVCNDLRTEMERNHMFMISTEWLASKSEVLTQIVSPFDAGNNVRLTIERLARILDRLEAALAGDADAGPSLNPKIEQSLVASYRQALARLLGSVEEHGISMGPGAVMHLADRLLAGETVRFEGEPLKGLQVMGMLETRAIDFDHLVVLSMNDKIMPRISRQRTFIPASIRRGHGLPGPELAEELYAYYFYRLISRPRDVTLVYDGRAGEGMRSGGKSRFLLQLEMLHDTSIQEKIYSFAFSNARPEPMPVQKGPKVMERLAEFTAQGKGRMLSASALMNYCRCQVLFYYKNVVGVSDDMKPGNAIDHITQGQIVHKALLNLYLEAPLRSRYLEAAVHRDKEFFRGLLSDPARVEREVRRAINAEHFHLKDDALDRPLTGSVAMTAPYLVKMVNNVIEHDMEIAPIDIVGCEITGTTRWKVGDAPEVNMRYAFDRVDVVDGAMRVVDYKTGKSSLSAQQLEDVFQGGGSAKYLLQLLTYANLLKQTAKGGGKALAETSRVLVYDTGKSTGAVEVYPELAKQQITSHTQINEPFMQAMEAMLKEIFNPDIPFTPTEDRTTCNTCPLQTLCPH